MPTRGETDSYSSSRLPGVIFILLTLAGWTSIPLFLRHFAKLIDPWSANGWRYGFSALLWLPVIFWALWKKNTPEGLWRAALIPSIFNAVAQVCFGLAPYYMDPGLMTFSLRFQIIFLTIGAALLFAAERRVIRSPGFLIGVGMVLGGTVATLVFKEGGLGKGTGTGVACAVCAGVLYAAYALSVRRYMHALHPLIAFAAVSQYTGAVLVALMLLFGNEHGLHVVHALDAEQMTWLLVSAVVGIGIGHTLYFASIKRLGLAVSTGVVQLQPVTVSICSIFIFHEKFTPLQWITGTIAVLGAGIMLWTQHQLAKRDAQAKADGSEPAAAS